MDGVCQLAAVTDVQESITNDVNLVGTLSVLAGLALRALGRRVLVGGGWCRV